MQVILLHREQIVYASSFILNCILEDRKDFYSGCLLQLMIISLLKGLGNAIMRVKDVESLLSRLLKRHSQYYSEVDKSSQKLSKTEVKILCLLLEVNSCVS